MKIDLNDATLCVGDELYQAGTDEEGRPYLAVYYFVSIELSDGMRYRHPATFPGCKVTQDDEGFPWFHDRRETARQEADALLARLLADGSLRTRDLDVDAPRYGSPRWEREHA